LHANTTSKQASARGTPTSLEKSSKNTQGTQNDGKELKIARQPRFLANCQNPNNVAALDQNKMNERKG